MKVETDITASMVVSQMGRAVIIVMYVETFRTVVRGNVIIGLNVTHHFQHQCQSVVTDNIPGWEQRKHV